MKKLVYCLLFIIQITVVPHGVNAQSEQLEEFVPKVTGDSYEKTKERLSWLTKQLHDGDNFHSLKKYPYRGFSLVKNNTTFQFSFSMSFKSELKRQSYLKDVMLIKRGYLNVDTKEGMSIFAKLVFHESKKSSVYAEFFPPDLSFLFFNDEGNLDGVQYKEIDGLHIKRIDKDTNAIKSEFHKYDEKKKLELDVLRQKVKNLANLHTSESLSPTVSKPDLDYCTKIPDKLLSTEIRSVLSRAEKYRVAALAGKADPFISHPAIVPREPTKIERANSNFVKRVQWMSNIWVFYAGDDIAFLGVVGNTRKDCGCFLVFDDQLRLQRYVEGEVEFDYNSSGHDVAKTAKLSDDGSGIEVTFHNNGYPSTYKSIVKKRLFGRQIEWNDKGEVVSDVDLDIPKEMEKYPPSKIESKPK